MIEERSDAAAGDMLNAVDPPGPIRGLLSTAIDSLKTRLDLIVVEAEIYLLRTLQSLLWAFAALASGLLALAFVIVAIIAAFWDTHRMAGVLGGAGAFAALCALFSAMAVRALRIRPLILEKTLQQLEHDRSKVGGGV
jgi:uncharacterized membrane protein YqjE